MLRGVFIKYFTAVGKYYRGPIVFRVVFIEYLRAVGIYRGPIVLRDVFIEYLTAVGKY